MKERLYDVIKWGVILVIAGFLIFLIYPKYHFTGSDGSVRYRCNKFTGQVERLTSGPRWEKWGKAGEPWQF